MLNGIPASRLRNFGPSIFAEMTRLAQRHQAVNLAQGFPDFPGPAFLKEAAVDAIRSDRNQYARTSGEPALVEAIAEDLHRRTGLEFDPLLEITVMSGATEVIHCAFLALCEAGDEVVILEPHYDSYPACCSMAGAIPRFVKLHGPHYRWDPAELRSAFGPRTRMLLLNTPHNPTGRVFSRGEMEELAALCLEWNTLCVTDQVYERLVYDGEHVTMASLPGMRERTVSIYSTGKTFSLTGWKIGYAAAGRALSRALATAHQFVTFASATPLQHALAGAFQAPGSYFRDLVESYRARRDFLMDIVRACGLQAEPPQGSYFVLADARPMGFDDGMQFCRHLVEKIGVAAVPAVALFADKEAGRPLVRFAFCKRMETLQEAARRMSAGLVPVR